jgi:hypothetical protein
MVKSTKATYKILFTNAQKETFEYKTYIPWIKNRPPKFILWDDRLWEYKGMGMTSVFYHEVESFTIAP